MHVIKKMITRCLHAEKVKQLLLCATPSHVSDDKSTKTKYKNLFIEMH